MEISENKEPCLVTTPQGFSVSYKDKLLYSKYDPSRAILQTIERLTILPETVLLCCSPVLDYGLQELQQKLPENCILLRCEFDKELFLFQKKNSKLSDISLLSPEELYNLPVLLNQWGIFKRVIRVDFSAGTTFHSDLYTQLTEACTQSILTYWANRLTLTKFGRRYSQNFFKNLKQLNETTPIENYLGKINKPIIVCGAGESLNKGIQDFKNNQKDYFIICADTALQPLLKHKVIPDGVFIEEAQHIITKAFIGTTTFNTHIFAGLSSINQISHITDKKKISYFTTEYIEGKFINNLKARQILPPCNKPFGSVGLTAVYYALQFRKDTSIPVYVYGLDFSYSAGTTHTRGALAHNLRLTSSNRLIPVQNYGSSFNNNAISIQSKDGRRFFTTPVMINYAKLFNSFFQGTENLYDSSECGIVLNIPKKKPEQLYTEKYSITMETSFPTDRTDSLKKYFNQEKNTLIEIKDLLTGKIKLPADKLEARITDLVLPREYLYLHFPDGNKFQYSQSFLNRIRTEIDFFLKYM